MPSHIPPRADWVDPLDDLRLRFRYQAEATDRWTILDAEDGPLIGDCDDFALTAAWILSQRSWWRLILNIAVLRMALWVGRTDRGTAHAALWVRGRGWICNIHPMFGPRRLRRRLPYVLPLFLAGAVVKGLRRA
ncbi:hypothetical protein SAMN05421774_10853 [Gemmobacter megaterium]|uniref:Uncharacterized protein n=1 Tax=Gemmobacter megaterium TaxID=1086013 RepID=A0A1N7QAK8_9RHOB|nr:hypothetical protein [Gemmobacter megaterium]GGE24361.1 hypothetical protein GCM10011345_32920 [Gemmobacter megaterium]SIT19928.1 hypothetical protein SAMN05421774_10853 [Gemmobacter megaterium]